MSEHQGALSIPAHAADNAQAIEFVRFWISGNVDHCSVRVGAAGDPAKEAAMWGFILADIAKHAVAAMRAGAPDGPSAQALMEEVMNGMISRLKANPELSGTVTKGKS